MGSEGSSRARCPEFPAAGLQAGSPSTLEGLGSCAAELCPGVGFGLWLQASSSNLEGL